MQECRSAISIGESLSRPEKNPIQPVTNSQPDKRGSDRHHIVEQTAARNQGYPEGRIDGPGAHSALQAREDQLFVSNAE